MFLFILCLFGGVHGHMGITNVCDGPKCVEPREKPVVFDAYRYPNAGHCHGVMPGTPVARFAHDATLTLTMSGGAAHNGGHCALFLAKRTDTETTWYKQIDNIDCTLNTNFVWAIQSELVPAECNSDKGCSLIWTWTPTSSGACEIYMNCFDIGIDGANGGASPKAITVTKNPICARVDGEKKTSTYGEFCGTECKKGGGVVVIVPPTSAPAPTSANSPTTAPAPTSTPPFQNNRCGSDWVDANAKCLSTCTVEDEATSCFGGDKCFADMEKLCENSPTSGPRMDSPCEAVGVWAGNAGIHKWCATNCANGLCPSSHCQCTPGSAKFVLESTSSYVPTCQKKEVDSNMTIMEIAEEYDLSSYQRTNDLDEATMKAAEELLQFNKNCGAISVAAVDEPIEEGKIVFITGDCQLTDDCPQPQSSAHKYSCLSSFFIAVLAMCLSLAM